MFVIVGTLFIIPTPIGNLGDITFRAIDTLKEVDLILAEDTRKSNILLKHYKIDQKVISNHKFNEHRKVEKIIAMLKEGKNIGLISSAGTPAISDPGYLLTNNCIKENIKVECLPGATALIPALVNSGLPSEKFCFEGFLPHKKGRQKLLKELSTETRTMIFYESPHRFNKTITQMAEHFGNDRNISVSRELTKIHEENITGTIGEVIDFFKEKKIQGEFVIIVSGSKRKPSK